MTNHNRRRHHGYHYVIGHGHDFDDDHDHDHNLDGHVIGFWIVMAAQVVMTFLIVALTYLSR